MRTVLAAPALLVVLALAACGPTPTPAPTEAPAPKPTETVEAPPEVALDEDVLLQVTATATSASGETLDLDLRVHRAVSWDDAPSNADLMTSTCEGSLENSVYEANLWSFGTADVTATGAWTSDSIFVLPYADEVVSLASSGFLSEDDDVVDIATPHCLRTRTFATPGEGTLVLGFSGDSDAAGAAGNFTRWANARYGFLAPDSVTISDCAFTLTPAGEELNGGAEWWSDIVSDFECSTGASAP